MSCRSWSTAAAPAPPPRSLPDLPNLGFLVDHHSVVLDGQHELLPGVAETAAGRHFHDRFVFRQAGSAPDPSPKRNATIDFMFALSRAARRLQESQF